MGQHISFTRGGNILEEVGGLDANASH
jgi:hypothetical protein